ncbi:hypothetical protein [Lentzea kentuckyensis]|uniref:hypothetical protein n=1 Tax=Lentzea kentuckyensis TaxID=360086 RepID=UPI00130241BD|nr:hypothetical protein [Lentzea kentuckyensis]
MTGDVRDARRGRAEAAAQALKGITDKDGHAVSVVVAAAVKEFEQLEGDGDERRSSA